MQTVGSTDYLPVCLCLVIVTATGWEVAQLYPSSSERRDRIWKDTRGNFYRSKTQAQRSHDSGTAQQQPTPTEKVAAAAVSKAESSNQCHRDAHLGFAKSKSPGCTLENMHKGLCCISFSRERQRSVAVASGASNNPTGKRSAEDKRPAEDQPLQKKVKAKQEDIIRATGSCSLTPVGASKLITDSAPKRPRDSSGAAPSISYLPPTCLSSSLS